jgi:hypothetical protein
LAAAFTKTGIVLYPDRFHVNEAVFLLSA